MFTIRAATLHDASRISAHRRAMFIDMGHHDQTALDAMIAAFLPWLRKKMVAGEYLAWMAESPDGAVAGGLGLWLMDWPPHMIGPGAPRGNILNVYTEAPFRRQGVARRLMETARRMVPRTRRPRRYPSRQRRRPRTVRTTRIPTHQRDAPASRSRSGTAIFRTVLSDLHAVWSP